VDILYIALLSAGMSIKFVIPLNKFLSNIINVRYSTNLLEAQFLDFILLGKNKAWPSVKSTAKRSVLVILLSSVRTMEPLTPKILSVF
jgi:hypothetical protein